MKTIKKIPLILLLLTFFGGKASVLNLESQNNFLNYNQYLLLKNVTEEFKLSELDFSVFIYTNKATFIADQKEDITNPFWELNTPSRITKYHFLADRFSNERDKYSKEYLNFMTKYFESLSSSQPNVATGICRNIDFSDLTHLDFDWNVFTGNSCFYTSDFASNFFKTTTYSVASTNAAGNRVQITNSGYDLIVGGNVLPCSFSGNSLRIENTKAGKEATKVAYTFTVEANSPWYKYDYAVVLQDPGDDHAKEMKPYFQVRFFDNNTGKEIPCATYKVFASTSKSNMDMDYYENFIQVSPNSNIKFKPWTTATVPFDASYIGHSITAEFIVSDCGKGDHFGYAYIDGSCDAGNVTSIGTCATGYTLTAPDGFKTYHWSGTGISGDNDKKSATCKGGPVRLILKTEGGCEIEKKFIQECNEVFSSPLCPIDGSQVDNPITASTCNTNDNTYRLQFSLGSLTHLNNKSYVIKISVGDQFILLRPPFDANTIAKLENLNSDGKTKVAKIQLFKNGFVSDSEAICTLTREYTAPSPCFIAALVCQNCIEGFAPVKGEKYVISAWVKEDPLSPPSLPKVTYNNPSIRIDYCDVNNNVLSSNTYLAKGKIIDGWQRIDEELQIPTTVDNIKIYLLSASGYVYFDDIRIYPVKGSLKSYVYDPISLKLVATLDENNYATFYEYDEEGTLIRTKKETERGIITISENRQNNPKRN